MEDYNPEDTRQNLIDTDSTTSYLISNNVISRFERFSYKNGKSDLQHRSFSYANGYQLHLKDLQKIRFVRSFVQGCLWCLDSKPVVFNLPSIRTVNGSNSVVSDVVNAKGKKVLLSFAEGDYWAYVSPNVYEQYLAVA